MFRTPRVLSRSTVEPITLEEARLHLRLDAYDSPATHPDDPLIEGLIATAREYAETVTGRTITQAVLELALDAFPVASAPASRCTCEHSTTPIELPRGPVITVDSFVYIDGDGVQQTLAAYQFDTYGEPPRLLPGIGASWPSTYSQINAVRVRYTAGYSLAGESPDPFPLPKQVRQAMLLCLGHWYENREDTSFQPLQHIPLGAEVLLGPFTLERGFA